MAEHISQFQGASGAFIVSLIAFTIVFVVLAGLTAVIYAIKFFAGSSDNGKKDQGTPAAPVAAAPKAAVATPSAPSLAVGNNNTRLTAVITAAILAATQGRGRILSITPAASDACALAFSSTRTWKTTGIVERIGGRLTRTWKH